MEAEAAFAVSGGIPLNRLNENNYLTWCIKMEMYLRREGLWEAVSNPPANPDARELRADEKAKACIVLGLEDSQLVHIRGLPTSSECWNVLQQIYVRDTPGSKIALTRRLYKASLKLGESLSQHLQNMRTLFAELEIRGMPFSEASKVYIILSSLDDSWNVIVASLESMPERELTLQYLTGRLLEEEQKRTDKAQECARAKVNLRSRKDMEEAATSVGVERALAVKRCYRCGSTQHLKRNCTAQLQEGAEKPWNQRLARGKRQQFVSVVRAVDELRKETWLLDSGSSQHISNRKEDFVTLNPTSKNHVNLADGKKSVVHGQGQVFVPSMNKTFDGVLLVPGLEYNLLSVSSLTQEGYTVIFKEKYCKVEKNGILCAKGVLKDRLYVMLPKENISDNVNTAMYNKPVHDNCIHLLHRRLGHANFRALAKMPEMCERLNIKQCGKYLDCAACKVSKSKAYPVSKQSNRLTKKPFELVHADLIGPLSQSLGGAKYVLVIVDDFTRYGFCYLLKSKNETFETFKNWVAWVERRFSYKVAQLQTDRGGEFLAGVFQGWLKRQGIWHRKTNPYSPSENGIAERRNGVLQTMKDSLLQDSGLSKYFWGEAILTANYILNRLWSSVVNNTPYYLLFGKKPVLSHLRIFGCYAWVHIPKGQRRKGQPKARKLRFVGYQPGSKAYRFALNNGKVVISRSAQFAEQDGWDRLHANTEIIMPLSNSEEIEHSLQPSQESAKSPEKKADIPSPKVEREEGQTEIFVPRRSERATKGIPPERFTVGEVRVCHVNYEPQCFEDVLELPKAESKKWFEAMDEEMQSMTKYKVFTPTQLPKDQKAVGCRWVYKKKVLVSGEVKYKARLVAQGFTQRKHLNFDETYAPTVRSESVRLALKLAALKKFEVNHFDITTAYLNAELKENIFMMEAPGYESGKTGTVYKLNKAIYGLKQSARNWNQCLDEALQSQGFKKSLADPCMYTKGTGEKQMILLAFVDDLCLIASKKEQIQSFEKEIGKEFQLKDLGNIKNYLGVEIERAQDGSFLLNQKQKIEQLLKEYNMDNCKSVQTPMVVDFQNNIDDTYFENPDLYQSIIGSLLYLAQWSRPDISNAVSILSRLVAKPTTNAWQAVKRIMRYLKGTQDKCLKLSSSGTPNLECYVDSDYAGDRSDRKSTTGIVVTFAGSIIGWKARKQNAISVSTAEAEFAALSELCNEIVWFKQLLTDVNVPIDKPVKVNEDSQTCIQMAKTERMHTRSKHVDIKYCNVRQAVNNGLIDLEYCESENNVADLMTKPLCVKKHQELIEKLDMVNYNM